MVKVLTKTGNSLALVLDKKILAATKITAKTPAHNAGTIDVRVVAPGGTSAVVSADKFKIFQLVGSLPSNVCPFHGTFAPSCVREKSLRVKPLTGSVKLNAA